MKKRLITMGMLALTYGMGCGGGEENNPPSGQPLPLAIGNWWFTRGEYDTTSWDTTRIVGDTVYEGHNAFLAQYIMPEGQVDTMIFYYADGFLHYIYNTTMESFSFKIHGRTKENMAIGDTWTIFTYDTTIAPGYDMSFIALARVLAVENITVPAGSFTSCYKLLDSLTVYLNGMPTSTHINHSWIAMGVGAVYNQDPADSTLNTELVDYYLVE